VVVVPDQGVSTIHAVFRLNKLTYKRLDVEISLPARPCTFPSICLLSSHVLVPEEHGLTPYLVEFDPIHIAQNINVLNNQGIPSIDDEDSLKTVLGYFQMPDDSVLLGRNIDGSLDPKHDILMAQRRGPASLKRIYKGHASEILRLRSLIIGQRDDRDTNDEQTIPLYRYAKGNNQGEYAFNIGQSVQTGVGVLQPSTNMRSLAPEHPHASTLQDIISLNKVRFFSHCSLVFF